MNYWLHWRFHNNLNYSLLTTYSLKQEFLVLCNICIKFFNIKDLYVIQSRSNQKNKLSYTFATPQTLTNQISTRVVRYCIGK